MTDTTLDEITLTEHEAYLLKQIFITLGCSAHDIPAENQYRILFTDGCRKRIETFAQGLKAAARVAERREGRGC